jgi:hypothetical protein
VRRVDASSVNLALHAPPNASRAQIAPFFSRHAAGFAPWYDPCIGFVIGETETSRQESVVSRTATYVVGALVAAIFSFAGAANRICASEVVVDEGMHRNAVGP